MMSVETVLDCVNNYKVQNGIVYDKRTNQVVKDETITLIVKTSRLLYARAKELNEQNKSRNINLSKEDCINKAINRYGFNGSKSEFAENKVIESILVNGTYQQGIFNDKIDGFPEFRNFIGANKDYTLALLKLKARQQGYDIQDINVSMDTSHFQKDGNSFVTISCPMTRYTPQKDNVSLLEFNSMSDSIKETFLTTKIGEFQVVGNNRVVNEYTELLDMTRNSAKKQSNDFSHETQELIGQEEIVLHPKGQDVIREWQDVTTPVQKNTQQKSSMGTVLDELRKQRSIAKQNNDRVAYNYAQSNIERIIRMTPSLVSEEQWNSMSSEQQRLYMEVKVEESRMMHDKDAYNYWIANLIKFENNSMGYNQGDNQSTQSRSKL